MNEAASKTYDRTLQLLCNFWNIYADFWHFLHVCTLFMVNWSIIWSAYSIVVGWYQSIRYRNSSINMSCFSTVAKTALYIVPLDQLNECSM